MIVAYELNGIMEASFSNIKACSFTAHATASAAQLAELALRKAQAELAALRETATHDLAHVTRTEVAQVHELAQAHVRRVSSLCERDRQAAHADFVRRTTDGIVEGAAQRGAFHHWGLQGREGRSTYAQRPGMHFAERGTPSAPQPSPFQHILSEQHRSQYHAFTQSSAASFLDE